MWPAPAFTSPIVPRVRIVPPPANANDVMREQLENLIAATDNHAPSCPCSECHRYARVKAILLEVFEEPQK